MLAGLVALLVGVVWCERHKPDAGNYGEKGRNWQGVCVRFTEQGRAQYDYAITRWGADNKVRAWVSIGIGLVASAFYSISS